MSNQSEQPIELQGWLHKRNEKGLIKGWKKRYFTLRGTKLFYSENETQTSTPIDSFDLKKFSGMAPHTTHRGSNAAAFEIHVPNRMWILGGTEQEVKTWQETISKAIQNIRTRPVSVSMEAPPVALDSVSKHSDASFNLSVDTTDNYVTASNNSISEEDVSDKSPRANENPLKLNTELVKNESTVPKQSSSLRHADDQDEGHLGPRSSTPRISPRGFTQEQFSSTINTLHLQLVREMKEVIKEEVKSLRSSWELMQDQQTEKFGRLESTLQSILLHEPAPKAELDSVSKAIQDLNTRVKGLEKQLNHISEKLVIPREPGAVVLNRASRETDLLFAVTLILCVMVYAQITTILL